MHLLGCAFDKVSFTEIVLLHNANQITNSYKLPLVLQQLVTGLNALKLAQITV